MSMIDWRLHSGADSSNERAVILSLGVMTLNDDRSDSPRAWPDVLFSDSTIHSNHAFSFLLVLVTISMAWTRFVCTGSDFAWLSQRVMC